MTAFDKDFSPRRSRGPFDAPDGDHDPLHPPDRGRSNVARLLRTVAGLWEQLSGDGMPRDLSAGGAGAGFAADSTPHHDDDGGFDVFGAHDGCGCGTNPTADFDAGPDSDAEFDEEFDGIEESDDERDWRRWYDSHRRNTGQVPVSVVSACLDDVREAGILHSVALLEIARKWGFDPRAD